MHAAATNEAIVGRACLRWAIMTPDVRRKLRTAPPRRVIAPQARRAGLRGQNDVLAGAGLLPHIGMRTSRRDDAATDRPPWRSWGRMGAPVHLIDLGRRSYDWSLEFQRELHARVAADETPETWIVVEHDPVITLGRNAKVANLLLSREALAARGVACFEVERGGDVTYHGPGQVVLYPIRRLPRFREVVPLVSALERTVIGTLAAFGIRAHRRPEHRGVYVGENAICAIGLAIRKMTSMHGIALNACVDLDYDRLITPCGTPAFGITSLSRELGRTVSWAQARDALLAACQREFGIRFLSADPESLPTAAKRD